MSGGSTSAPPARDAAAVPVRRTARSRRWTAPLRLLPDFLVIGARCTGTTSLYSYLAAHPGVGEASRKEVHFFDQNYPRGLPWYRAHFPTLLERWSSERRLGHRFVVGEATPYYLYHPACAERVARSLPNARLIVLLRNPIDRAYSHYHQEVARGLESLSFEEAIEREPDRLRGTDELLCSEDGAASLEHRIYSYLARGRYAEQLARWFQVFPRERFLILESGELLRRPDAVMSRLFRFLDLPEFSRSGYERRHQGSKRAPMSPGTRERLRAYFQPYNEELFDLLGQRFDWD